MVMVPAMARHISFGGSGITMSEQNLNSRCGAA
jgi:hypothetical protein